MNAQQQAKIVAALKAKLAEQAQSAAAEQQAEEEPPKAWEKEPDRFVKAQDCIRLRFVGGEGELGGGKTYQPEYAHQIFEDEAIELPLAARPLTMEVCYAAGTLDLWVRCAGDTPPQGDHAEDALYKLAGELPAPCASLEDFSLKAAARCDPAALCGELCGDEYTTPGGAACGVYCGALGGDAARVAFAERMQSIFRWYIEGYSAIDLDDERWRFFGTFETASRRLVAAATVFRFSRWEDGGPRTVLRICQVAVLPQCRAQGHGTQLLRAIHAYARGEGAVQVTVEDPNPQFRLLRDLTDVRACLERKLLAPASPNEQPTDEQLAQARAALLLTDEQMFRCWELQQYQLLQQAAAGKAVAADVEKPFRLAIKRRLNKRHQEELEGVAMSAGQPEGVPMAAEARDEAAVAQAKALGTEARKRRLEELYQETVAEYKALAQRVCARAESK